jgi:pantothenate kinase
MKDQAKYTVITDKLPILNKGDILVREGNYYTNEDESVIIRSTNYTGKIFKRLNEKHALQSIVQ